MLLYASAGISELEIPGKRSLVIYISNCQNSCKNCHTSFLQKSYGDLLNDSFSFLFELYYHYFDVVCFMGEGKNTEEEHIEFKKYCDLIHSNHKQVALYSGRDCTIEEWMNLFDYIKIGSYQQDLGPLTSSKTNQRLYQKVNQKYVNITNCFWEEDSDD